VVVPAAVDRFILKPQWEIELLCSSLPLDEEAHARDFVEDAAKMER
jgi:hypothetical protein